MSNPPSWSLSRSAMFLIVALLIHCIMAVSLPLGALDFMFHDATRDYGKGFDFFTIYQAGYNFLHGMNIYFGVREHSYGPEHLVVPYFSGFRYLPFYAYTYGVVLTLVSPWTAYWLWIAFIEGLLLFNIALTKRLAPTRAAFYQGAGMWLAYSPLYLEWFMGQQSMVTVTLLHLIGYGFVRGRQRLSDWGYIGSALWKLNTLMALPLFIRLKRYRMLLILGGIMIVSSAPYFALMDGSWREFALYFKVKMIADGPNAQGLWALSAMLYKRAGLNTASLLPALKLMTWCIIGVSGLATIIRGSSNPVRLLSIWICTFYLSYRYVWEHHYIIILPLVVLLWVHFHSKAALVAWALVALPTPFALFNIPGVSMPQSQWTWQQDFLMHSKVLPVLGLWLVLCMHEIYPVLTGRERLFDPRQWLPLGWLR